MIVADCPLIELVKNNAHDKKNNDRYCLTDVLLIGDIPSKIIEKYANFDIFVCCPQKYISIKNLVYIAYSTYSKSSCVSSSS